MNTLSRRDLLQGVIASVGVTALVAPSQALASTRESTHQKINHLIPTFKPYKNPNFSREDHIALHHKIEAEYGFANDKNLNRWNSSPDTVFVNEAAGESIHITGVNLKEGYAEMIWVLAPTYTDENGEEVVAHVPFEHEHSNQDEQFENISGRVCAVVNGELIAGENAEFFTAKAHDDHIGWNPGKDPLVMRVRYAPAFDQDGETAMLVYWGFVNESMHTDAIGRPKNIALLGALSGHLAPQAKPSNISEGLTRIVHPFLLNPLNQKVASELYKKYTNQAHPLIG